MADVQKIFDNCQSLARDLQKVTDSAETVTLLIDEYGALYVKTDTDALPTPKQFAAALHMVPNTDATLAMRYETLYERIQKHDFPPPEALKDALAVIANIADSVSVCDPITLYNASKGMLTAMGPFDGFKPTERSADAPEGQSSLTRKVMMAMEILRLHAFTPDKSNIETDLKRANNAACWITGKLVLLHQLLSEYREEIDNDPEVVNQLTSPPRTPATIAAIPSSDAVVSQVATADELRQLRANVATMPGSAQPPEPPYSPSQQR